MSIPFSQLSGSAGANLPSRAAATTMMTARIAPTAMGPVMEVGSVSCPPGRPMENTVVRRRLW